jgi:uncharacterized phiE125 gp8 family phage protein
MNAILIAPPATEPVSLSEARAWLRIDTTAEDAEISTLIVAARMLVEATTRRALVSQGWRLVCDQWPFAGIRDGSLSALATRPTGGVMEFDLPLAPLTSISILRVYDHGGQPQIVPANLWRLGGAPDKPRLFFAAAPPQPGVPAAGIEIDVIAGYGGASDVPAPLRQAILALVARWFENRGDVDAAAAENLPKPVAALLAPYRRGRLA